MATDEHLVSGDPDGDLELWGMDIRSPCGVDDCPCSGGINCPCTEAEDWS